MKNKYKKIKHYKSLDEIGFIDYEEFREKIDKKVGLRPKLPKNFPKGNWSDQSLKVLSERYLIKDEEGFVIETPEEMCWRVAFEVASAEVLWGESKESIEEKAEEFYRLLISKEFLPNSPTLMNAGTGNSLQYSGCFVLPIEDSLVGIFDAIKYQALIHQTGGGTGFSFSKLRPRGSIVKSSHGVASGPISFMRIFNAATNEIKQGGRRRGANMGILRVDHPDILEFIHCKEEGGITNFNISVAVTDKFMEAIESNSDYELLAPKTDADGTHYTKAGKLSAKKVWEEIAKCAWRSGDPGIIFIDRINKGTSNPVPSLGPIESTNPCGEQPLYPYDSCNLGSIFLNNFVIGKEKKEVDWEKLKKVTRMATRFMDDVIEVNPYPLKQIRQTSLALRRIGLGVGGWADMLIDLGIPYDSDQALDLAERIMKVIKHEAESASEELAEKRGPFPLWSISIYKGKKPRRNSTVTTIAPTGSISIFANSSSGIEPIFALAYQHKVTDKGLDRTLNFINPKFIDTAREKGFWNEELEKSILSKGYLKGIGVVPQDVKKVFVTAHEIDYAWHIKMQATFQKYTENAVSKTINMRSEVTKEDIEAAYLLAWQENCNGITVFRDGCKNIQVLNMGIKEEADKEIKTQGIDKADPLLIRPLVVKGATYRLNTPIGSAFITINEDDLGEPLELFINIGKAGSDVAAMAEALGRTISATLRFKGSLKPKDRAKEIALQLAGIGGRRSVGFGPNKILSLPDAIAYAISKHFGFKVNGFLNHQDKIVENLNGNGEKYNNTPLLTGENGVSENPDNVKVEIPMNDSSLIDNDSQKFLFKEFGNLEGVKNGDLCPTCGATAFVYQEGCGKCYSCGYSEC